MRTNIVLIDSENVQPDSIEKLRHDHFRVCVFIGANQKRIDIAIVRAVQALGAKGEYVQISGNGPNALDFHIAFYIGKYSAEYPDAYFHIISKDKGFDPLIKHLKEQKIFCSRSASVSEMRVVKLANKLSPKDLAADFVEKRIRPSKKGPSTVKKLHNSIHSHFLKRLSEEEVFSVVEALKASGRITVNGQKVAYAESV